jgi:hypothetical protein
LTDTKVRRPTITFVSPTPQSESNKTTSVEDAMHLRPHEHTDLVLAAVAAAKGLKAA